MQCPMWAGRNLKTLIWILVETPDVPRAITKTLIRSGKVKLKAADWLSSMAVGMAERTPKAHTGIYAPFGPDWSADIQRWMRSDLP